MKRGAKNNLERSTENEKTRSYVIYFLAEVFKGGKSKEKSGAQQVRMKSGFKDEF